MIMKKQWCFVDPKTSEPQGFAWKANKANGWNKIVDIGGIFKLFRVAINAN